MADKGTKSNPFIKDPDDPVRMDFGVNWTKWLATEDDTLSASEWAILVNTDDDPLVIDSDSFSSSVSKVWLMGGKVGTKYALRNRITTADARTTDQTVYVLIKDK